MQLACGGRSWLWLLGLLWLSLSLFSTTTASAAAEPVGEVTFVRGVASAQRAGETPRFLQKGEPLHEGETINTSAEGFALIALKDGSKFTIRPNSSFTIETFRQGAQESAVFTLLKGGVRALTGLISKRNPRAVEVRTTTATIGIRGTQFDARLCEADCAEEEKRTPRKAGTPAPAVVARVAALAGTAQATGADGRSRPLSQGAALFNGDTIRTEKASHAVLAFRDRSKVTVIADSEFKLDNVQFRGAQAERGNFAVRILRGGVRALTGLLGKRDPKAVTFGMTTAVIGLRGSGFDAIYEGDAELVHGWLDAVNVSAGDQTLPVDAGQSVLLRDQELAYSDRIPDLPEPRPDTVEVDFDALFAAIPADAAAGGVALGTFEGVTALCGAESCIELAAGEAAWLQDGQGAPVRITPFPRFMLDDPTPPANTEPTTLGTVETFTQGNVICEIR